MRLDEYGEGMLHWQWPVDVQYGFAIVREKTSIDGSLLRSLGASVPSVRQLPPFYRGRKNRDSQGVVPRLAASEFPGNMLEKQILKSIRHLLTLKLWN